MTKKQDLAIELVEIFTCYSNIDIAFLNLYEDGDKFLDLAEWILKNYRKKEDFCSSCGRRLFNVTRYHLKWRDEKEAFCLYCLEKIAEDCPIIPRRSKNGCL